MASTGFEPVISAIPVRCSTNWAMKPHIGSEVNLLSSYLRWGVKWCEVYYEIIHIWTVVELLSNCLNWKINCDHHFSLSSTTTVQIWIISYILHIISLTGDMNSINWPRLKTWFFQASSYNCLNWKIDCDDHFSL